ncbi:hypothetical protein RUM43_011891 [Polyplax serrata]|uniref:Uncharacterized protein n=1 Tax=Polyplax serrata TaxID=468196 RepID=A0AAN8PIU8_POLSC
MCSTNDNLGYSSSSTTKYDSTATGYIDRGMDVTRGSNLNSNCASHIRRLHCVDEEELETANGTVAKMNIVTNRLRRKSLKRKRKLNKSRTSSWVGPMIPMRNSKKPEKGKKIICRGKGHLRNWRRLNSQGLVKEKKLQPLETNIKRKLTGEDIIISESDEDFESRYFYRISLGHFQKMCYDDSGASTSYQTDFANNTNSLTEMSEEVELRELMNWGQSSIIYAFETQDTPPVNNVKKEGD